MMSQEIHDYDSYSKVNADTLLLMERLRIVKDELAITPFYRIRTIIKLQKELKVLEKETDKIGERLKRLDKNPIQIIKRP